jgi:putative NADH-flavin reductase
MRLLVFGASGKTGHELVRQAIDGGHTVTAFVRTPEKLKITGPSVRVVRGNVADSATVSGAIPGHDAVVSALGVSTPLKHDADVISGIQNIIGAMEEHGIGRLIYLSFIGVRESRAAVGFVLRYIAPIPLRHEIADHEMKESMITSSRLAWTIVRAPKLMNGPATGRYRSGDDIRTWKPVPMLSRSNVARFVLRELVEPRYVHRSPRLL